jgi:hypothetical protein
VDEKGRWQESVTEFDGQIINVVGDVMISSGVIAYLGSVTVSIHSDHWIMTGWHEEQ